MKRFLVTAVALLTAFALAVPAGAITRGGAPDAGEHPYVGLMVADGYELDENGDPVDQNEDESIDELDYVPLWRCSGALIDPTTYVTAGHCTEYPAFRATIWFEEDVQSGIPDNGYPSGGATSFDGTTYTHPLYNPNAFFLYDLGVVVLDGKGREGGPYAELPDVGAIDDLGKGRKKAMVEAVGYGLQKINPVMFQGDRIRLKADLFVVDTNGVAGIGNIPVLPPTNSMMLSGDAKHGGTCFGDSGGPILIGNSDVIGGVTSFGLNGNCAGVGGAFRIDRKLELNWISGPHPTP